jgi:Domain of unknown function (DUF1929)/Glyoxal oxidase N-terminus
MSDNHDNGHHTHDTKHDSFHLDTVAVHLALLRTGKIIAFTGDDTKIGDWNIGKSSLWDPTNPNVKENPQLARNLFCAGHCFLSDGRLLVAGGQSTVHPPFTNGILSFFGILQLFTKGADHDIDVFDPEAQTWNRYENMPKARWYPTCVTLPDGRALIVSGVYSQAHNYLFKNGFINETYEIFDPSTNSLTTPKPFLKNIKAYPFLHVLPGGTLFVHTEYTTRLVNLTNFTPYPWKFETIHKGTRTYPGMGCCTLLPINQNDTEFRVLIAGGSMTYSPNNRTDTTNTAEIFTLNSNDLSQSGWKNVKPTNHKRFLSDAVLLPDGTVLVTNGAATGISDDNKDAVKEIELYNPQYDTWTVIDMLDRDRLYHSSALLLADGRVVAAGSTGHKWSTNPEHYEKEIEIIIPPYLKNNPQRPDISDCPSEIAYDSIFEVKSPKSSEITKVVLIRNSSTTHNNNMDQRCLVLSILDQAKNILKLSGPKDGTYAPPGYYMLFILDKKNIPSVAKMVIVR